MATGSGILDNNGTGTHCALPRINSFRVWNGSRDDDGFITFSITHRIEVPLGGGPNTAIICPGLPTVGSQWAFNDDTNIWCFCTPRLTVTDVTNDGDPSQFFDIVQWFTNKPLDKCQSDLPGNPLLKRQVKSGGYIKYTEEATLDRFGQPIKNSAHEQIRGPQNEWDASRPFIRIEQNVATLDWSLVTSMVDTVNKYPLWGYPARTIKLSTATWNEHFYGNCQKYYSRVFDFEIKYKLKNGVDATGTGTGTGLIPLITDPEYDNWDRDLVDEGTKVLHGEWNKDTGAWVLLNIGGSPPDPTNPQHFSRFTDRAGNPMRALLNGAGLPAEVDVVSGSGTGTTHSQPGKIRVEKYPGSNFLLLKIPTVIED